MNDEDEPGRVRAALAYPFEGEASKTRLLAGAALHFVAGVAFAVALAVGRILLDVPLLDAFVVAPAGLAVVLVGLLAYVPLAGYAVAAVRGLLEGRAEPPAFDDWPGVVRDGLWAMGVTVAFGLPLAALAILGAAAGSVVGGGIAGTAVLAVAAGLAVAYGLLAAVVAPASIVNATHEGSLRGAWAVEALREALTDGAYLGPWLAAAVIWLAGLAVGAVLTTVVVGFVVLFVAQLAAVYLVTWGMIDALEIPTGGAPPPPPASGYVPGWDDRRRRKELTGGLGGALLPTRAKDGEGDLDRPDGPATGEVERARSSSSGGDDVAEAEETVTDIERPTRDDEDDLDRYES